MLFLWVPGWILPDTGAKRIAPAWRYRHSGGDVQIVTVHARVAAVYFCFCFIR
jgi:hypothetical protein